MGHGSRDGIGAAWLVAWSFSPWTVVMAIKLRPTLNGRNNLYGITFSLFFFFFPFFSWHAKKSSRVLEHSFRGGSREYTKPSLHGSSVCVQARDI